MANPTVLTGVGERVYDTTLRPVCLVNRHIPHFVPAEQDSGRAYMIVRRPDCLPHVPRPGTAVTRGVSGRT
jgi:hypothetical protein